MTKIGRTYGDALYALACEAGAEESWLQQVQAVQSLLRENPDYLRLLADPSLPKPERRALLDSCFSGRLEQYLLNFLKLLCDKEKIRSYPDCARQFTLRYNVDHNILEVTAYSAVALTEAQKAALTGKLQTMTGKTVQLACRLDPSLLGGLRLEYDGKLIDGSVRTQLRRMQESLNALSVS